MSISSLYDTAKQYADKIMLEQPSFFSGSGGSLTLISDEKGEIIFGITSIRIADGRIITVPSEYSAIASMVVENKKKALEMVTVSFYDYSVAEPSPYCLNLLLRAEASNKDCQIAVSPDESITASELKEKLISEQAETDDNDIPTEFMDGFDFGEGNPFDETGFDSEPLEKSAEDKPAQSEYQQPFAQPNQPYTQPGPQVFPNQPYPNQPYVQPAPQPNQQAFPNQPYPGGQPYGYPMYGQPYPGQPYGYPQMYGQPYGQPYGYPQMYGQQPGSQSVYIDSANPYNVNPQGQSVSVSNSGNTADSTEAPRYTEPEQNLMQKKLASLIGDSGNKQPEPPKPEISKEEMLRRINQEKKSAKGGLFGKK